MTSSVTDISTRLKARSESQLNKKPGELSSTVTDISIKQTAQTTGDSDGKVLSQRTISEQINEEIRKRPLTLICLCILGTLIIASKSSPK